ncbi:trypsin-like [Elgaria multicarinata webbii]|uniref:trypsin-like n=1 Tax=Elgaria multicarinata webbii TaxID=159646 RepID=UPI002FCD69E4
MTILMAGIELLAIAVLLIFAVAAQMRRGFQCVEHSQPWTVALFDGWKFHCTGTLIHKQWLVTSAQCYTGRILFARLGEHSLWHIEFTEQFKITTKLIRHPFYDSNTKDNDIMLVKLLTPVFINKNVQPLTLPTNCVPPGSYCVLAGWGTTIMQKEYPPDVLYCGNITTLPDQECLSDYPTIQPRHMLCATVKQGGADSCQGDPGSPLVCNHELQGITSWGFDECSQVKSPSVFVRVCNYVSWLQQTMASA